ncbi:hypothetical protein HOP50_11g61840 [Chloropicon primus]|uniref:Homeobox domain-containing protein n=1 Tax=Chloropicon primus TaxID=1764295 RepID=A0A5B8MV64_9CHLO|nr:hypothetical protein A3770_11p61620 [Chloropicon primus]UPR02857.1 hypothetical protein HOP50_11g61840 [Chloropicon primus]|eukprot:QDZ23644.1 hypothetical protein A3770_11p61620 [Chloropicon primus]
MREGLVGLARRPGRSAWVKGDGGGVAGVARRGEGLRGRRARGAEVREWGVACRFGARAVPREGTSGGLSFGGGEDDDKVASGGGAQEGRLPLYTSFSDALEPWQLLLLEEAYSTSSRRKVSVTGLSEECKLSRTQVLGWLKSRSTMSDDQVSTIRATCLAAIEREERLEETYKKKKAKKAFADLSLEERKQARVKEQKMSPLAVKTLLKFWGRNKNPSWQNINDIARMTKLSPAVVRGWFNDRKETSSSHSRSAGSRRRRKRTKI